MYQAQVKITITDCMVGVYHRIYASAAFLFEWLTRTVLIAFGNQASVGTCCFVGYVTTALTCLTSAWVLQDCSSALLASCSRVKLSERTGSFTLNRCASVEFPTTIRGLWHLA